jgi:predicted RNA binding protein YcfA (HicA-like mRNA interferase family)
MKSASGRVLTKALERNGWLLLRVHGSHHIYGKDSSPIRLSLPVHGDRPLKTGLLRHLLGLVELSEDDV